MRPVPRTQFVGAVCSLVGFYGIALPCAYLLGFTANYGTWGVWLGLVIGYSAVSGMYLVITARLDWAFASHTAILAASAGCEESTSALVVEGLDASLVDWEKECEELEDGLRKEAPPTSTAV